MRSADRTPPTIDGHRPDVEPWPAQLYIGVERQPVVNYVYDDYTASYDSPSHAFTYDDRQAWPYDRQDLWCDFHGLTITTGTTTPDGQPDAGHVEMTLDNRDGALSQYDAAGRLVDWIPGAAVDIWTRMGAPTPYAAGYLTPAVGAVTTPDTADMTIVGDFRLTAKVRRVRQPPPAGATFRYVAFHMGSVGGWDWVERNDATDLPVIRTDSKVASSQVARTYWTSAQTAAAAPYDADAYIGVRLVNATTSAGQWRGLTSPDGATWTDMGAASEGRVYAPNDPVALPVVGASSAAGANPFPGRIYWAQMESLDAAGNVTGLVWRFDADDYPGTGTSYVDPRGRTWTLSAAGAITPKVPAVPPEAFWLFSGEVTAWRELGDGTVEVEAFDALSKLNEDVAVWDPGNYDDTVGQRLDKILATFAYTGPTRFDAGTVRLHSYQTNASPLDEVHAVADSDGGVVFVDADGALLYRNRTWTTGRIDQPTVPLFSDNYCAGTNVVWDAAVTTDDDAIVNRAVLKNVADETVVALNTVSRDRYGTQTMERTADQWIGAAAGQALADLLVARRGDAYLRVDGFTLHLTDPQQDLWRVGIDRRLGDVVTWYHEQPTVSGINLVVLNLVVASIVHEITPATWAVTLGTSRTVGNVIAQRYDRTPFNYDDADPRARYVL